MNRDFDAHWGRKGWCEHKWEGNIETINKASLHNIAAVFSIPSQNLKSLLFFLSVSVFITFERRTYFKVCIEFR